MTHTIAYGIARGDLRSVRTLSAAYSGPTEWIVLRIISSCSCHFKLHQISMDALLCLHHKPSIYLSVHTLSCTRSSSVSNLCS